MIGSIQTTLHCPCCITCKNINHCNFHFRESKFCVDIEVAAGLPCAPTKKICLPGFICTLVFKAEPESLHFGSFGKTGGQVAGGVGGKSNKGFLGAEASKEQVIHLTNLLEWGDVYC